MLQTIHRGKAGRVETSNGNESWRELFKSSEDLITGAFFGRLPYLSDECIADVMALLLGMSGDASRNLDLGVYVSLEFWPQYSRSNSTSRYVEPDLLVEFEQAYVLIEVKRPRVSQDCQQWENEIAGFLASDLDSSKEIWFVALGGKIESWRNEAALLRQKIYELHIKNVHISFCSWQQVMEGVENLGSDRRDSRVLGDMKLALELTGVVRPIRPLTDLAKMGTDFYDLGSLATLSGIKGYA